VNRRAFLSALPAVAAALALPSPDAPPAPVMVHSTPLVTVQDSTLLSARGAEGWRELVLAEIDRALRQNAHGLATRVREMAAE
jgi:hypothetical protein